MFVYSVRASTLKFFTFVIVTLALVAGVIVYGSAEAVLTSSGNGEVDFSGIKTNEDRVSFIERLGVAVNDTPIEEKSFTLPKELDRVIAEYNEIQKRQGLDLSKYTNKKITRYTYEVTNYKSDEASVYANLFVYRNRIVACDISGSSPDGFVIPLTQVDVEMLKP